MRRPGHCACVMQMRRPFAEEPCITGLCRRPFYAETEHKDDGCQTPKMLMSSSNNVSKRWRPKWPSHFGDKHVVSGLSTADEPYSVPCSAWRDHFGSTSINNMPALTPIPGKSSVICATGAASPSSVTSSPQSSPLVSYGQRASVICATGAASPSSVTSSPQSSPLVSYDQWAVRRQVGPPPADSDSQWEVRGQPAHCVSDNGQSPAMRLIFPPPLLVSNSQSAARLMMDPEPLLMRSTRRLEESRQATGLAVWSSGGAGQPVGEVL